jgi:hypothetical protein
VLISGIILTHRLPEEALPWVAEARDVFDEMIICIDEKRTTPETIDRAQTVADRVIFNRADTWYGKDSVSLIAACTGDWIFVIDYDEQLSPEWQQDGWRRLLETTDLTHFWIPRRWVLPGRRYISADPWWPAFQLRLFRKNLSGTAFPTRLHDHTYVPGASGYFRNLALDHHVLWLFSRAAREDRVRFYEQLRPGRGLGYFYLYEDYAPPQADLPKPVKLDLDREIIRMEKLPAEEVSRVTLEVSAVPAEVHVSAMFWLEAKVTNATNSSLYPVGPYPVRLAYHWLEKMTRQTVVFDGDRSGLFPGLDAGATEEYLMTIIAPDHPGEYILQTTLVQDGVYWFENVRPEILQEFVISVTTETSGR